MKSAHSALAFVALLFITGCPGMAPQVDVTASLEGDKGSRAVSMEHGSELTAEPSIVFAPETMAAGRADSLSVSIDYSGVATATGYESVAVLRRLSANSGSIFTGQASAGDRRLLFNHTGSIAKTSYYFYEDAGESSAFTMNNPTAVATSFFVARVRKENNSYARIPSTSASDNYFSLECLTGGDDPCFDMTTLIQTLFTALSTAVSSSVTGDLSLGGPDADGDFRLDYLPAMEVRRGCGSNPPRDPGFGFLFGATVDGPLGIQARIHIPIIFSLQNGIGAIDARVHPFGDLGGCQEMQFIDTISVSTATFLGIGAQAIADSAQTSIVCGLFGPTVGDFDCTGIASMPLPTILTSGLAAMMGNTLTFYWRQAHGDRPVPENVGVFVRPINGDNTLTSTNVTPGASGASSIELAITQ